MRAAIFTEYGGPEVLRVVDVPVPRPGPREVLVRVSATTVTAAEVGMRRGQPVWGRVLIGFRRPRARFRRLGTEFAGTVAAVGAQVRSFAPGQTVFGFTGFRLGANAEYLCLPETASLATRPAGLSDGQAAALIDGASTALYFLRDRVGLRAGQRVLVIGASGSVGGYAVQLARHLGAEVTGVCSGANADLVRSWGAADVVDYTTTDFTTLGRTWDVVFDAVGRSSFRRCRPVLARGGVYAPTTGLHNVALDALTALNPMVAGRRVRTGMSVDKRTLLPVLRDLAESGQLEILVERSFPLEQIADAHRHVESGHKRGNVVLQVSA
jgi:NADPH:quinone reductase-like Zn-dependent oxidoreductase